MLTIGDTAMGEHASPSVEAIGQAWILLNGSACAEIGDAQQIRKRGVGQGER